MKKPKFVELPGYREYTEREMTERSKMFFEEMRLRRSVRHFSKRRISAEVIRNCLMAAGTAPSGANMQPWHFVAVIDKELKRRIREEAEWEEREFYHGKAPDEWLKALEPLGTDANKPFLEEAPCLICIFAKTRGTRGRGKNSKNYYVTESVGIAAGILITAVHHAGLVCLTHTPSPMKFLNKILDRPGSEKPFLILVVGYPAEGVKVPDIKRKPFDEMAVFK